jgi:predicted dinucleotide-binding enzyme
MKIAIVGSGNIAQALAPHWKKAGHTVAIGTRTPGKGVLEGTLQGFVSKDVKEAAKEAEGVAFAIPGGAVLDSVRSLQDVLGGKVLIVPANDTKRPTPNLAKAVLDAAPAARVIRAFNTIPAELIASGTSGGRAVDLLYVSHPEATATAESLIGACGLRPIRVGDIDKGHLIDDVFELWATLAFGQRKGRGIHLSLQGA